jgi:uncharacterized membrane protein YdjX (TVP38/TMEM64 family)
MTAVLERVPVDRITAEARAAHPGRVLLTLIAGVLYGLGWLTAKTAAVAWLALAWSFAAVKVGWQDARRPAVNGRRARPAG